MSSKAVRESTTSDDERALVVRIEAWLRSFSAELPVVVVPVFDAYADVLECVASLLRATPSGVPILVLDDGSTDMRISQDLSESGVQDSFLYIRKASNTGFVGTVNLAFNASAPHDVVVINSDVVVPLNWMERLKAAAYCRSNIATATPLTNHGSIVSIPNRNVPTRELPEGLTLEETDARIQESSLCLYPVIPTAVGHCTYFRRLSLDAVGCFDETFAPGYGEEVDFSQRALSAGLIHVLADDLFVFHRGSASFEDDGCSDRRQLQEQHERVIQQRYPWYHPWVSKASSDESTPLSLAIERARAAVGGYRIAFDATCVGGPITGTQILTLELIRAVAEERGFDAHIAAILHDGIPSRSMQGVNELVDEVLHTSDFEGMDLPCFDLVHRPFQISAEHELVFLRKIARRCVVSQLDLIAYSNPTCRSSPSAWMDYRELTCMTFDQADGIAFNSFDVAEDAVRRGLMIPDDRSYVAYNGVNHALSQVEPIAPAESRLFGGEPFILMLGTNFRHKNRVSVLKIFRALVDDHYWSGDLVFAGPNVLDGGSEDEEAQLLSNYPQLKDRVHYLGVVSEAEKRWLLANAALVVYPSNYEGFGLVPFEAAAMDTPALTTNSTSLREVLGDQVVYLKSLDPKAGAEAFLSLLVDAGLARQQIKAIQERGAYFTWDRVATRTWDFYTRILAMLPRHSYDDRTAERSSSPGGNRKKGTVAQGVSPWRRRLGWAFYLLFTQGFGALFQQMRNYFRWLWIRIQANRQ